MPRILTVLIKGPGFRSDRICVTIIEREAYVKFSTAIKIGLDRGAGRGRNRKFAIRFLLHGFHGSIVDDRFLFLPVLDR